MQSKRIATEKATVKAMIEIYCKSNHRQNTTCDDCVLLIEYALVRTDKCKYGNNKPACKVCSTHCYNKENRTKIKEIMRFSGPRMIFRHPILSIRHLLST
ncbi:MAG: nitrous oxide-stimulated promoter family protein [Bacteroidota bacterium]